jgi:hypothetical protein
MLTTPPCITVSSILKKLHEKNYDHEFQMTHQGLSLGKGKFYAPGELRIVETFNFDDRTNPSYSSILYVIETNDGETGYSLDAYGALKNYKSSSYEDFFSKIPAKEEDEELVF